jgi:3-mercaptopyruvate sulfurtransferase SseA
MANSLPLISSGELAARLRDHDVLVADCRFAGDADGSRALYERGHIPGALHVYWLDDLSAADTTVTTFLPNAEEAADRLGRLGITQDKLVVAYSDGGNLYASRLWHVLAHHRAPRRRHREMAGRRPTARARRRLARAGALRAASVRSDARDRRGGDPRAP